MAAQTVAELHKKGNEAYSSKRFADAERFYSKAIDACSERAPVLYSNRSASRASRGNWKGALEDASECILIDPAWYKGYARLAAAHLGSGQPRDALAAYSKALQLQPDNKFVVAAMKDIQEKYRDQLVDSKDKPKPSKGTSNGASGGKGSSRADGNAGERGYDDGDDDEDEDDVIDGMVNAVRGFEFTMRDLAELEATSKQGKASQGKAADAKETKTATKQKKQQPAAGSGSAATSDVFPGYYKCPNCDEWHRDENNNSPGNPLVENLIISLGDAYPSMDFRSHRWVETIVNSVSATADLRDSGMPIEQAMPAMLQRLFQDILEEAECDLPNIAAVVTDALGRTAADMLEGGDRERVRDLWLQLAGSHVQEGGSGDTDEAMSQLFERILSSATMRTLSAAAVGLPQDKADRARQKRREKKRRQKQKQREAAAAAELAGGVAPSSNVAADVAMAASVRLAPSPFSCDGAETPLQYFQLAWRALLTDLSKMGSKLIANPLTPTTNEALMTSVAELLQDASSMFPDKAAEIQTHRVSRGVDFESLDKLKLPTADPACTFLPVSEISTCYGDADDGCDTDDVDEFGIRGPSELMLTPNQIDHPLVDFEDADAADDLKFHDELLTTCRASVRGVRVRAQARNQAPLTEKLQANLRQRLKRARKHSMCSLTEPAVIAYWDKLIDSVCPYSEDVVSSVVRQLDTEDKRYLVLTGPCGSGKTVLAMQIAAMYACHRSVITLHYRTLVHRIAKIARPPQAGHVDLIAGVFISGLVMGEILRLRRSGPSNADTGTGTGNGNGNTNSAGNSPGGDGKQEVLVVLDDLPIETHFVALCHACNIEDWPTSVRVLMTSRSPKLSPSRHVPAPAYPFEIARLAYRRAVADASVHVPVGLLRATAHLTLPIACVSVAQSWAQRAMHAAGAREFSTTDDSQWLDVPCYRHSSVSCALSSSLAMAPQMALDILALAAYALPAWNYAHPLPLDALRLMPTFDGSAAAEALAWLELRSLNVTDERTRSRAALDLLPFLRADLERPGAVRYFRPSWSHSECVSMLVDEEHRQQWGNAQHYNQEILQKVALAVFACCPVPSREARWHILMASEFALATFRQCRLTLLAQLQHWRRIGDLHRYDEFACALAQRVRCVSRLLAAPFHAEAAQHRQADIDTQQDPDGRLLTALTMLGFAAVEEGAVYRAWRLCCRAIYVMHPRLEERLKLQKETPISNMINTTELVGACVHPFHVYGLYLLVLSQLGHHAEIRRSRLRPWDWMHAEASSADINALWTSYPLSTISAAGVMTMLRRPGLDGDLFLTIVADGCVETSLALHTDAEADFELPMPYSEFSVAYARGLCAEQCRISGDLDDARRFARQAMKTLQSTPNWLLHRHWQPVAVMVMVADVLLDLGQVARACRLYATALVAHPGTATAMPSSLVESELHDSWHRRLFSDWENFVSSYRAEFLDQDDAPCLNALHPAMIEVYARAYFGLTVGFTFRKMRHSAQASCAAFRELAKYAGYCGDADRIVDPASAVMVYASARKRCVPLQFPIPATRLPKSPYPLKPLLLPAEFKEREAQAAKKKIPSAKLGRKRRQMRV